MLTTVSDAKGLQAALATAHAGDTIQLASGTYAAFTLKGLNFSGAGVTITSKNPAAPAVLTGAVITNSSGLTLKGLELTVDSAKADNPFQIYQSNHIVLDHLNVHGSLDGNAQNDQSALLIRNSSNVSVTNSEFHQLQNAVAHVDSDHITVSNNYFHEIRTDGVHGGGSSFVTISQNYFSDFSPVAGDHGDAIQFWTAGTTASAHDITISNNIVMRGAGGLVQGVFMRDESGVLPYQNVNIDSNFIAGAMNTGIGVGGGTNVSVTNNEVVALPDQKSGITLMSVTNGTMANNQATQYAPSGNTNVTETNDSVIASATDGGKALLTKWLASHPGMDATILSDITAGAAADRAVSAIEATRVKLVTLNGDAAANTLATDGIHDTVINAGAGNDILYGGGVGHNTLSGGAGDDTYYVKSAFDVVVESANGGTDLVCSDVDYVMTANVENLRLTGAGTSGTGNDLDNKITGNAGGDTLLGMGGNDNLVGGAGADVLSGGAGNDNLVGGAGADTLIGGPGADTLSGGAGADVFVFGPGDFSDGSHDRIVDFSSADGDKISLKDLDANTLKAGDQAFSFIGAAAFHHVAGELHYEVGGGLMHVMGDTNGDGVADFSFDLVGVSTLKAADFLL